MMIKVKKYWSFVKTLLVWRRSRNEIIIINRDGLYLMLKYLVAQPLCTNVALKYV